MTRILAISNMYPPHHLGGYELSCRDVMDRLGDRGHEVTVLTTRMRLEGVTDPTGERDRGIRRDLAFYWEDHRLLSPPLHRRLAIERANQAALARAIDEGRPEVVSAWNMGAMSLGLLTTVVERRLPLVLVVCDDWLVYGPRLDAWARLFAKRPLLGRIVRRATGVPTLLPDLAAGAVFCFVSDMVRRRAAEQSRWRPRDSTVVYSGIDRRDFPPPEHPDSKRPWRWRLLCVGRLDDRKGTHVAIEALRRLPEEATLEIVGRGDPAYLERLHTLVAQLGLDHRVRFDVVPRERLRERYVDADAVVFPTVWDEPFGLVPVEAMACRTPVIATGTGGSAEFLIDRRNCLLVQRGDAGALGAAIARLAGDTELRARLVRYGLQTAEQLDIERYADVLESWHVAAAERFARGRPADRPKVTLAETD